MGALFTKSSQSTDKNMESLPLIWFGAAVDDSQENVDVKKQLRSIINYLKKSQDATECEKYIESMPDGDRVLLIVSGGLGQEIVPRIHMLRQILSIYVFCIDKEKHEKWARKFTEVILSISSLFTHRVR
jgi:hypothetical protein